MKFGTATIARMPMIATTIINSIKVNPLWIFFRLNIGAPSWGELSSKHRAIPGSPGKLAEALVTPHVPGAIVGLSRDENCHRPRRTSLRDVLVLALVEPELRQPVAQRAKADPEEGGRALPH